MQLGSAWEAVAGDRVADLATALILDTLCDAFARLAAPAIDQVEGPALPIPSALTNFAMASKRST